MSQPEQRGLLKGKDSATKQTVLWWLLTTLLCVEDAAPELCSVDFHKAFVGKATSCTNRGETKAVTMSYKKCNSTHHLRNELG